MNFLLLFLLFIVITLIGIFLYKLFSENKSILSLFHGGVDYIPKYSPNDVLNVFLDERNFYYSTKNINLDSTEKEKPAITSHLKKLKEYLHIKYPKKDIKMHIITKNSNMVDYSDELDIYDNRYEYDDILYVANTTFDTEKISKKNKTHYLRGRDDFLALILASEYLDNGEKILIISNDKFRDVEDMFKMPEFNMIKIYQDQIEKRHINPSKYRFLIQQFKKIISNPKMKIEIPQ